MAGHPQGGGRASATAAVASAVIALVSTVASVFSAYAAISAARSLADAQRQDDAREEISGYVVRMSELDREGGSGRRNEIGVLGKQVDSLVARYGQEKLGLSATTYRLVGLFVTLSTTDLELASRMAHRALELAGARVPDGAGGSWTADPLEALQAHRVLADIAAQNLDSTTMAKHYRAALVISADEGGRNRYVDREAPRYTRVYWTLSAMMVAEVRPPPTARDCAEVHRLAAWAKDDLKALESAPEVGRRAVRIERNVCKAAVDLEAMKRSFTRG
ncbi:hypothetical protein [Streptomyces sp. SP18CS02]|uniref:hypothetical protein n=1 Tax=Streptomyces sp. SP18CS02 TaxID=3002531 RepID=UPI002E77B849|nr:hypothetical protein [Streptomyces sp. SP18CS02]MEE1757117.1 hypothetical protein [Streptomyces sp. SP18CS02]